ncbi:MAG: beta-lactamase family protein [Myxococcales bacterium]|nr:beta-lactamase family protein [Myxococcales bacterium]
MSRAVVLAIALSLNPACGGGDGDTSVDATPADAAPDAAPAWAAVDEAVGAALTANGNTAAGLIIFDADDHELHRATWNGFAIDQRVAIASASKMISGLVLFDVVRTGQLTLDSTTGGVLGWTGPNAAITLRDLLSFTSGLPRDHACTSQAGVTLAECVAAIAAEPLVAAPGTRFDYGSTHLQVAARMAEVATGRTWAELFRARLADPLGLPAEVAYFTFPRQSLGQQNPLVAGGLRASMAEYAPMLRLVFHRGVTSALTVGTAEAFAAQATEPHPGATIGVSPAAGHGLDWHYGLTAWLECPPPATACPRLSSAGAFGFTPWVDREHGYYAILGMQLDTTGTDGIANFALDVEQAVQPLIVAELAR